MGRTQFPEGKCAKKASVELELVGGIRYTYPMPRKSSATNAPIKMLLCAGLQSSGTTLVSWCFLQRRDTNGVLDMRHDCLYTSLPEITEPNLWVKMTIGAFRWQDAAEVYRDLGWDVTPLLVVRDVRAVFASLMTKSYGFNGNTAEEPPLRMRFRRFLRDWELFRIHSWPIFKFEDVVTDGEDALKRCCEALALEWDPAMTEWPKTPADVAQMSSGNATFMSRLDRGSLHLAMDKEKASFDADHVPASEMAWLDSVFAEYNTYHGYPLHVTDVGPPQPGWILRPQFEGTKRQRVSSAIQHLDWIPALIDPTASRLPER